METEIRYSEVRAEPDGRILIGRILVYRDVAILPFGREMFLPGAFSPVESLDVILNLQHQRTAPIARTAGGGLYLEDGQDTLSMRADLPESSAGTEALNLVRGKILRGLSVEFKALQENMVAGVREISKAMLTGIGLVDRPAYPKSNLEARENQDLFLWHERMKKEMQWL